LAPVAGRGLDPVQRAAHRWEVGFPTPPAAPRFDTILSPRAVLARGRRVWG